MGLKSCQLQRGDFRGDPKHLIYDPSVFVNKQLLKKIQRLLESEFCGGLAVVV